jgi:hypothetical protein
MGPDVRRVALGRLEIAFSGDDFIRDAALEEMRMSGRDSGACAGTLGCRFGGAQPPAGASVHIDRFLVGHDALHVRDRLIPHTVRRDGSGLEVGVRSVPGPWRHPLVGSAIRLVDQGYNDAARRLAKRFHYTVLDQAVQLAQVPLRQTWVHSSAVTDGTRTVLFMAWGGVGKTAALLSMLETGRWRFLCDDLAVLDDSGTVHRNPQRVQVFATNTAGQDGLRTRLLAGRSAVDRAHWAARHRLLGGRSVRRRVHVEEVFGPDAAAESGSVTDAVYLRRTSADRFSARAATPRELGRIAAAVLQVELQPLQVWLSAVHGAHPRAGWPTAGELSRHTASIIEAGLATTCSRCAVVDVPLRCRPEDIRTFVRDQVLG